MELGPAPPCFPLAPAIEIGQEVEQPSRNHRELGIKADSTMLKMMRRKEKRPDMALSSNSFTSLGLLTARLLLEKNNTSLFG